VVVSCSSGGQRLYLLLHRAHQGPDFEGDWAWTPPSGARFPDEDPERCAHRELMEETGLTGPLVSVSWDNPEWAVFRLDLATISIVRLDDEHDRFEWVNVEEARRRCQPAVVRKGLELAHTHVR